KRTQSGDSDLKLLLDNTHEHAICTVNDTGVILGWNKTAERLIGYASHEVIGKNYAVLFPRKEVVQKICIRKDQTFFWSSFIMNTVVNEEGTFMFYALVIQDITEKKEREQQKD